jgi:hypothetical protein
MSTVSRRTHAGSPKGHGEESGALSFQETIRLLRIRFVSRHPLVSTRSNLFQLFIVAREWSLARAGSEEN